VWRDRFLAIANGEVRPAPTMLVMRDVAIARRKEMGEKAITKIQDWQDDEVMMGYCRHPRIGQYVEAIIGGSFKSVHTMVRRGGHHDEGTRREFASACHCHSDAESTAMKPPADVSVSLPRCACRLSPVACRLASCS
jgi:hypothetical protein